MGPPQLVWTSQYQGGQDLLQWFIARNMQHTRRQTQPPPLKRSSTLLRSGSVGGWGVGARGP